VSKLYSYTYMSLDGVIESPERWSSPFFSDELGRDLASRLESAAAMVLGRVTYDEFAAFWPRQSDDVPFATLNNTIEKLVVSDSLGSADWQNTRIISDAEMEELKANGAGDFHITGSGTLVRNWIRRGLLDEVILVMCPVLVGDGKRFFENGPTTPLTQVGVEHFPCGVMALTYVPRT
jgi:dihydrofolate reductase